MTYVVRLANNEQFEVEADGMKLEGVCMVFYRKTNVSQNLGGPQEAVVIAAFQQWITITEGEAKVKEFFLPS